MKKIIFLLFLALFLLSSKTAVAQTQKWFYPMTKIDQRATVKGFGMYIDNNFYKTHPSSEFPNHFYGYHAAQDLETFQNEEADGGDVPVYFVTSGTISYIGSLSGYGGVVLVKLDGTNDTALYGHIRISGIEYSVGQHISIEKPTVLTYLGNGFSNETSGERKHLHFGIYKGQDLYFHGHEPTMQILNAKWYNPLDYLNNKDAQSVEQISPTPISMNTKTSINSTPNLLERIIALLRKIL